MLYATMGDATENVTTITKGLSDIVGGFFMTEQQRIEADRQKAILKAQGGAGATGADLSTYLPWIVGGVLGVGVLIFLMKR